MSFEDRKLQEISLYKFEVSDIMVRIIENTEKYREGRERKNYFTFFVVARKQGHIDTLGLWNSNEESFHDCNQLNFEVFSIKITLVPKLCL